MEPIAGLWGAAESQQGCHRGVLLRLRLVQIDDEGRGVYHGHPRRHVYN